MISKCLDINSENHLTIGGMDVCTLAEKYGTPLYIMDENLIRENLATYRDSLNKFYNGNGMVLYASKAFSCKHIYKVCKEENTGIDVVSVGELYTALKADFPAEKIYFHGNNKTNDEIKFAVENNVGRIVADNLEELERINKIAGSLGKKVSVLFRIKPGIDAHTHQFIMTGQIDSKFGFALETGEAMTAIKSALSCENLEVTGIHCHIGSQIFDLEPFKEAAKVMFGFVKQIKDELNVEIKELNLGGGFGIKYLESDDPIEYSKYIEAVSEVIHEVCEKEGINPPKILMEPGRSIVGEAGITVYTVGSVKDIPNVRKYVSIDGGMTDNPRFILYQSEYSALVANRADAKPSEKVTIAGKCCESGDLIAKDIMMPEIKSGDYLAVMSTGAYNYSMSSNYNRTPKPPVVMVKNGVDTVVVKRETYEDLIRNDL